MGSDRAALTAQAAQAQGRQATRGRLRSALTGILFVLKTGIPCERLPKEMCCGSGMTCWRRLREWHDAGMWVLLHRALLDRLGEAGRIDWEQASLDSAAVSAPGGRKHRLQPDGSRQTGLEASPCSRPKGRPARGKAHRRPTSTTRRIFEKVVDAIASMRRPRGRPRKRPEKLHADKAYDFGRCRKALRERRVKARIARRRVDSSERLGHTGG